MKIALSNILIIGILCFKAAMSAPITWTDWTSASIGSISSAAGNMGGIGVSYTGNISGYQLEFGNGAGTQYNDANYWIEGTPAPYTGNALIDNAPTANELIATTYSGLKTINFSQAVINPIMAIVSQGQPAYSVSYDFDTPFTVLSEGRGFWGDGFYTLSAGDVLTGNEFHGVIQFSGTLTSINWVSSPDEYWHGFTIGAEVVPEPATLGLFGLGLLGLLAGLKKRQKKVIDNKG